MPKSPASIMIKRLLRSPGAVFGLTVVVLLLAAVTLGPLILRADANEMVLAARLQSPGAAHVMGTDSFGRDVFARILLGGRISLQVGVVAVAIGGLSGTLLGAVSGFYGRWIDQVVMRVIDALHSFPAVLLAMAIMGVMGTGLVNIMLAVGITSVPAFARITRSAVLSVRSLDYVTAADALGARPGRVLWRHIFPNAVGTVIVTGTLQIASAILAASSLSFLGLGIQPPTPEWGNMLAEGRAHIIRAPWLSAFPGVAIMLTVMGFNLLGDALRDVLDPTLKGSTRGSGK